jgi:hypothetical protein
MKRNVIILLLLLLGVIAQGDAQILEKIAKKVAEEVMREVVADPKPTVGNPNVPTGNGKEKQEPGKPIVTPKTVEVSDGESSFKSRTKRESFGPLGDFFVLSPDGLHIATSGFEGSRQLMYVNGKPDPVFDGLHSGFFQFSKENGHYAYIGKRGGECIMVVDGKEVDKLSCRDLFTTTETFLFSDDGKIWGYGKGRKGSSAGVLNGMISADLSSIDQKSFKIKGKHFYYTGSPLDNSGKSYLFKDNKPEFENSIKKGLFHISNDGEVFAYLSQDPETREDRVIINGKVILAGSLIFMSMDEASGAVFCSEAGTGNGAKKVFWNNNIYDFPPETGLPDGAKSGVAVSSDGKQFAIFSYGEGGRRVWLNGKPSPYYKGVSVIDFVDNQLIYVAQSGGKEFVVFKGNELGPYGFVKDFQVSKDKGGYTYVVPHEQVGHRYVNGENFGNLGDVRNFTFSPDGSRNAAIVWGEKALVIDGKRVSFPDFIEVRKFDVVPPGSSPFIFSPQGNRLAFNYLRIVDRIKREAVLRVDDKELSVKDVYGTYAQPKFSPDGKHFAVLMKIEPEPDKYFWKLYIDMNPGPIVGEAGDVYEHSQKTAISFINNTSLQVIGVLNNEIVAHTIDLN